MVDAVHVAAEVRSTPYCMKLSQIVCANTVVIGAGATRHRAADDRHSKNIAPYVLPFSFLKL